MLLALSSPRQIEPPRDFTTLHPHPAALSAPLPPLPSQRAQQPAMTLCPPPTHRRRPKLSLQIDQNTRRSFSSARANTSRVPQTAMSPTSRNTLANANLSSSTSLHRGYSSACTPRAYEPELSPSSSSSSSASSSASSSDDDDDMQPGDLSPKEKKRKRRQVSSQKGLKTCHNHHANNPHTPADAFSFLPKPQPSKRGASPSDRRVRFAAQPIVIPREPESESEPDEGGMTAMERMIELQKLRSKVRNFDVNGDDNEEEEQQAGKEGGGWMWKLGKMEYEEISKMEEDDCEAVPPPTSAPAAASFSAVGFGFGSGI